MSTSRLPERRKFPQVDDATYGTRNVPRVANLPQLARRLVNSEAADSIRRHAVLDWRDPPDHYRKLGAKGWPEDRVRQLILTLDALNYGNPKYLLLMVGWSEAMQGRAPTGRGYDGPAGSDHQHANANDVVEAMGNPVWAAALIGAAGTGAARIEVLD